LLPGDAILPYVVRRPYPIRRKGMKRRCGPCSGRKVVLNVSSIYIACFRCGHYLSVIEEVALLKRLLRHSIETTIVLVVRPDLCNG
jgi:hypothetical protein